MATQICIKPSFQALNPGGGVQFYATAPNAVFSLQAPATGTISAAGYYLAPSGIIAPYHDTVAATAVDGTVATALVSISGG
jgi:hypothetical protein